jgi:catechol 2,3-dioxygenase-like lactoylglutathione lyase family enzyme
MTANKDFKRIVRAKARRTGQSYSSVLQRLRTDGREPSKESIPMTIVRTVPDIRALDLAVSRSFYEDLLGFKVVMDQAGMLMFASPTEPKQQVTLNGDAAESAALPPGFAMDVGFPESVTELHARAVTQGCVIVEPLEDKPMGIRRFSLLDPNGVRITVMAHLAEAHQPRR